MRAGISEGHVQQRCRFVPGSRQREIFGERETAIGHWQGLLDAGIYTNLMIPPAAPSGKYIVRISLSAAHSDEDIDYIIGALEALASRRQPAAAVASNRS